MDPLLQSIITHGVGALAKLTSSAITTRVKEAKAHGKDEEVITAQTEIINELVDERDKLYQAVNLLREQFVTQQITDDQFQLLTEKILPLIKKRFLEASKSAEAKRKAEEAFTDVEQLLDPEILGIAQVLGFNFKYAIGEALSELVHDMITGSEQTGATGAVPPDVSPDPTESFMAAMLGQDPGAASR